MTPNELFAKELMTYDVGIDSHNAFYNNLPYVKDYDLCNWRPLRMLSGNIIKFYQYRLDKPVVLCTDPVDSTYTTSPSSPAKNKEKKKEPEVLQSELSEEEPADEPVTEDEQTLTDVIEEQPLDTE